MEYYNLNDKQLISLAFAISNIEYKKYSHDEEILFFINKLTFFTKEALIALDKFKMSLNEEEKHEEGFKYSDLLFNIEFLLYFINENYNINLFLH